MNRRLFLWGFALLAATPVSASEEESSAYQRGIADAKKDLAANKLAYESYGKPLTYWKEYTRILKERHGIELRIVAGCFLDEKILGHARGYNEVMQAEITKRFGADVFEKAKTDAKAAHDEANPKPRPKL